jgi:alpha-L-fucosidase
VADRLRLRRRGSAEAGQRYDAFRLTKADGKGKWWQGLDPQDLYTGRNMVIPDGIDSIAAANAWHDKHDGEWLETPPPNNPKFVQSWLARQNDLVDRYRPDMVYFDNYTLPLGQAGLAATAHYYNQALAWRGAPTWWSPARSSAPCSGAASSRTSSAASPTGCGPSPGRPTPASATGTTTAALYDRDGYKSAKDVIQRLIDVVSKNGCLLVSIPQRGDGTIDDKEEKVLEGMAGWIAVNGPAIYASRPWRIYGEGPTKLVEGMQNEGDAKPFEAADIRFTTKGGDLYALPMAWPTGELLIQSLATSGPTSAGEVRRVELLGGGELAFRRDGKGLRVTLPSARPAFTPVVKISGPGLV